MFNNTILDSPYSLQAKLISFECFFVLPNVRQSLNSIFECHLRLVRGKEKLEQLPCDRFLQGFEISRGFLPQVSYGEKGGKFQIPIKLLTRQFFSFFFLSSFASCNFNFLK